MANQQTIRRCHTQTELAIVCPSTYVDAAAASAHECFGHDAAAAWSGTANLWHRDVQQSDVCDGGGGGI